MRKIILKCTTYVKNFISSRKFGFTLSEVLITLGIIGIVAALTIPSLIQKQKEKITIVKIQKAYSVLSQAYQYAVEEYGIPSTWGITARTRNKAILARNILFAKIKVSVKCDENDQSACNRAVNYYTKNSTNPNTDISTANTASVLTADGFTFFILTQDNKLMMRGSTPALRSQYAWIYFDINGKKKPNTYGKDFFTFYLTDYGIIPVGTPEETGVADAWPFYSKDNRSCYNSGTGCTAWILRQKNMNYLHSDKCSWTNTSCK